LLQKGVVITTKEATVQYTIEARELTREHGRRSISEGTEQPVVVEAMNAGEAITRYVQESGTELVSISRAGGQESIATVKKEDSVFLVRVYAE
jgi:hypothetical protein